MLVSTYGLRWTESEAHVLSVQLHKRKGARFHVSGISSVGAKSLMARIHAAFETLKLPRPFGAFTLHISPPISGPIRGLDVPVALAFLAASGELAPENISRIVSYGNLALDGAIEDHESMVPPHFSHRQTSGGSVNISLCEQIILPQHLGHRLLEPSLIRSKVRTYSHIKQLVLFLEKRANLPQVKSKNTWQKRTKWAPPSPSHFEQLEASEFVKKALVVAASGEHHTLILGSPGTGKSLMAQCIHDLLPPLSEQQHDSLNQWARQKGESFLLSDRPPFRQPHCLSSSSAIIGSFQKHQIVPGECSMAAGGILCLDEFPEFSRDCIESLRGPLESHTVNLALAQGTVQLPSTTIVVATGNPCPCGFVHDHYKNCACSEGMIKNYMRRISGPIAERFHIHLETSTPAERSSSAIVEQFPDPFKDFDFCRQIVQNIRQQRIKSNQWKWSASCIAFLQSSHAIHPLSKRNDQILMQIAATHEQVLSCLKRNNPHVEEISLESLYFALQLRIFNRPKWWQGGWNKKWPQFAAPHSTEI